MRERFKKFMSNKRNRVKFRALMLLLFLLGVNTFAWFIYISKVSVDLTASVVSWDITFMDENTVIENAVVAVTDMKPGMPDFSKEFRIINRSGLNASFDYTINKITIFGDEYQTSSTLTSDDLVEMLTEETPFTFSFLSSSGVIDDHSTETFEIGVTWPYESSNTYVKVNSLYEYNDHFDYYLANGSKANVTASNYNSMMDSIYLTADDADTYWGEKSAEFIANGGTTSIIVDMTLEVRQAS